MNNSLLKNCLRNLFFEENKGKLKPSLFEDETKEIYNCISECHEKFGKDITPLELFSYWKSKNPTSTQSWNNSVEDIINSISNAEDIDDEISAKVIENLYQQDIGLEISKYGFMIMEGNVAAIDSLKQLLQKCQSDFVINDFGDPVTDNIYEIIASQSNNNRFKFNIPTLSREVYGIGRGEFGVIAAYSNVGKTAFAISLCAAPAGFCQQGAKVVYIANEEVAKTTKMRAIMSYTGMTKEEVFESPEDAYARYSGIRDRLIFQDAQGWDISVLESYLAHTEPDLVIIDMADKIALTERFNSGHERLRELYYRLREAAKTYNCALIGLSQASAEAEGRTRITMSMLEGSKLGKAAESDIMLGLGKMDNPDDPDDSTRWITVMKNKISGWHGTVMCNLDVKRSRYVA